MSKYLLKIEFDCNDADYVYGVQIIDEDQKTILDRNMNKEICLGAYDFSNGTRRSVDESISVTEISDEYANILEMLGLAPFGEEINIEYLDNADEFYGD